MGDFLRKLLLFAVFWGIFFLCYERHNVLVPAIRAWVSNPLLELQTTIDQNVPRERRYYLSYLFPKIYPIPYVCAKFAQDEKLEKVFLPGDSFEHGSQQTPDTIRCGTRLSLDFTKPAEITFARDALNPAIHVKSGNFLWSAESFSLVLSYMTLEVNGANVKGYVDFPKAGLVSYLAPETATEIHIKRNLLPNFDSPQLLIHSVKGTVLHDFNQTFQLADQQVAIGATSLHPLNPEVPAK